jgi:anti-sigma factor RsiW
MSCEGYRDKLIAMLASGESAVASDVAMHLRACAECKKFYETQVSLFGAIESGVRAMVNETVPASLLPRVRAQIAETGVRRRMSNVSWGFATVAVAAVLAVSIGLLRRNPENTSKVSEPSPFVAKGTFGVPPVFPGVVAAVPKRHSKETETATVRRQTVKTPEVMVLAEERAAFMKFVTDLPEERDVAVAYTRPVTEAKDDLVEIASLQIDELEVKPLESSDR